MIKTRISLSLLLLVISLGACKESVEEEKEEEAAPASQETSAQETQPAAKETDQPKPLPKKNKAQLTCSQQGIPSWEGAIQDLVSSRCEKCHSPKLAYKGILLTNYQELVANQEKSRARIQTNSLTEPLDPVEQQFFMDFFKAGSPEKESDCRAAESQDQNQAPAAP